MSEARKGPMTLVKQLIATSMSEGKTWPASRNLLRALTWLEVEPRQCTTAALISAPLEPSSSSCHVEIWGSSANLTTEASASFSGLSSQMPRNSFCIFFSAPSTAVLSLLGMSAIASSSAEYLVASTKAPEDTNWSGTILSRSLLAMPSAAKKGISCIMAFKATTRFFFSMSLTIFVKLVMRSEVGQRSSNLRMIFTLAS
mmetsp:Transcript_14780/g.30146  ORF Transcript_14780/g.30146 Transcript_14780/m.30146 type:complete len:200 (+) Transcript_14780:467-1066(+)